MAFQIASGELLEELLTKRYGETRIGERIGIPYYADIDTALEKHSGAYVLLGIPEDIGVRANLGLGGAHTAWMPALKAFLNTQSNRHVSGSEILLLGHFDFLELMSASMDAGIDRLRELTALVDDEVFPVIQSIAAAGKTPIIVGGGHNNAFPILKGCSLGLGRKLNCINLDAHSDFRRVEGRHSGNGFRFARNGGFLEKYALPWLHEAYNSASIVEELEADANFCVRFAETEQAELRNNLTDAIAFTGGASTGIELDLDCIAGVLSSAATPSGLTAEQARWFVRQCAVSTDAAYLHLAEGATELRDGRKDPLTAKLISYLIRDFIAARKGRDSDR